MGQGEDKPAENIKGEKVADSPADKEKKAENTKAPQEKKDVDSLRKVIKVDQPAKASDGKTTEPAKKEKKDEEIIDDASSSRESLEQKRAILQNIKDFDFQIKKNQEDIGGINKKIDAMSKDLDDLVSLYEIVSEQMNPFVGLSKVTKKRLDALENFTREIDTLKERTGELESFAERSGAKLQRLGENQEKIKTIDTDALLGEKDKKEDKKPEEEKKRGEQTSKEEKKENETKTETKTTTPEETQVKSESIKKDIKIEDAVKIKEQDPINMQTISEEIKPQRISEDFSPDSFDDDFFADAYNEEKFQLTPTYVTPKIDNNIYDESFDIDLDMIFEMAFGSLSTSAEEKIDMLIDEFIESLKG